MPKSNTYLELEKVFKVDAFEIFSAREKCLLVHRSGNIVAAGDQVESTVRKILAERFPTSSYVGQGHVVDSEWHTSGQLDIVISDSFGCPILFRTNNRTEYFPYESVYAIGEVKSTYEKTDNISSFVKKIEFIKSQLHRERTDPGFISTGRGRGFQLMGTTSSDRRPYKNPLFSFMLFVNSDKLRPADLKKVFSSHPIDRLPCITCFLDRGVVVYSRFTSRGEYAGAHEMPEFAKYYQENEMFSDWVWLDNKDNDYRTSHPLAHLYFLLSSHIRNCMLTPPDLQQYSSHLLARGKNWWKPLSSLTDQDLVNK